MDSGDTMLNEISQTEKNKYCTIHSHIESKIKTTKKNKTKLRLLDTENRLVIARGKGVEEGHKHERDQEVQTSSCKRSKSWGYNVKHGEHSQ